MSKWGEFFWNFGWAHARNTPGKFDQISPWCWQTERRSHAQTTTYEIIMRSQKFLLCDPCIGGKLSSLVLSNKSFHYYQIAGKIYGYIPCTLWAFLIILRILLNKSFFAIYRWQWLIPFAFSSMKAILMFSMYFVHQGCQYEKISL